MRSLLRRGKIAPEQPAIPIHIDTIDVEKNEATRAVDQKPEGTNASQGTPKWNLNGVFRADHVRRNTKQFIHRVSTVKPKMSGVFNAFDEELGELKKKKGVVMTIRNTPLPLVTINTIEGLSQAASTKWYAMWSKTGSSSLSSASLWPSYH